MNQAIRNAIQQLALPGGTALAALVLLTYFARRAKSLRSK